MFDYAMESSIRAKRNRDRLASATVPKHQVEVSNVMSDTKGIATEKRDVYATVTSQIVNAIEKGVGNWRMPWHTTGRFASSPINTTSRKPYRGINTVCLWAAA